MVTGRGNLIHIFFVAKKDDRYRLWHTVSRESTGTFQPAVDVLGASGGAPMGAGTVYRFIIGVGICPPQGASSFDEALSEIVIAVVGLSASLGSSGYGLSVGSLTGLSCRRVPSHST